MHTRKRERDDALVDHGAYGPSLENGRSQSMPRYLGIDYGTKRIGLSVGDTDVGIASPLEAVEAPAARRHQCQAVLRVADAYGVDAFVVGLPMNMDCTEGAQAKLTRAFGDELARAAGKDVHYYDERLSSRVADDLLRPVELTRGKHKARRDAVAAQVILQGFLDSQGRDTAEP